MPSGFRPLLPLALQPRTNWSPTNWDQKSSDRGHLPVVIRKAGLNGPPGLGTSGPDPFQFWSINRRPETHARPPRFWSGHVSAYLGSRSAKLSSKPERGRSLTILDRVARPEPAVEACPAQLILISGAIGHSVPAALSAQSPPQRIALVSLEQRAGGYRRPMGSMTLVSLDHIAVASPSDSKSSPMPAPLRGEANALRHPYVRPVLPARLAAQLAVWLTKHASAPRRSDLVPD